MASAAADGISDLPFKDKVHRRLSRFTQDEVSAAVSRRQRCDLWLYSVPIWNLLYDVAGDATPPSVEQLRDIMTLFGLTGALMLSVVTQLSSAVDYDQLVECRSRYGAGGSYHELMERLSNNPVDEIIFLMSVSFWIFTCCTLGTTFFLFALSTGADQLSNFRTRLNWWRSARWAFLMCFALLVSGCATTARAFNALCMCLMPDPDLEDRQAGGATQSAVAAPPSPSPTGRFSITTWSLTFCCGRTRPSAVAR
jgi:hypothetical protein